MGSMWDSDEVVQRFRDYLRIPSVHPDIDYNDCVKFLKKLADDLNLPVTVHELVNKKPIVVITWKGTHPEMSSILLNSHMDVVPVYDDFWKYPPFDAHITEDGWIYARGSQDMKSVGILHLEAVRRLKQAGVRLKRTVHITFVPEEEIGGVEGMKKFSESEEFRRLNVGFALDESIPSDSPNTFIAFNGDRTSRQIKITCKGEPGHGAIFHNETAGEKGGVQVNVLPEVLSVSFDVRLSPYEDHDAFESMGGVQVNVLPEVLSVSFDVRLSPYEDHDAFESMILGWCREAGNNVTMEYYVKNLQEKVTKIDGSVHFWNVLKKTVSDMGYGINCSICPGTTDARYIRRQGIPAIGFSPFVNTPLLLHAHNERLHVDEFKKGIDVMEKVLRAVANS